jgi:energy-coupling factor transporter ATP-binding protein EcfA2
MAKALLTGFRISGDVIDAVSHTIEKESHLEIEVLDTPKEHESLSPQNDERGSELRCEKDGLFLLFTLGSTTYRVGGVKPLFVTSLRVNIRASSGGTSYYDSIDLYAARGRASFAQAVHRAWGAEPVRIERDLVLILERLEKERDEQLRMGSKKETVEMSGEERERGLALLRDPRLFDRVVEDLTSLGYVGEELNKQLLYLCASSRKLEDPISVLILSQSASGKSFLVDCVKRLMPPDEVVAVTSLSDQALNYIEDLSHKFLVLGEAVHGEVVEYQIREMLSGKELSRLVTVKDPETGKMQSRVVRTPVIVASVMSGTNHAINPENASRCFVVNTDESREQTHRIQESQRRKYSLSTLKEGQEKREWIIKSHRAAQRLLTKREIVNDFAPHLDFPTDLMRTRRDHDRFLDLIACVCYLRQYQKREETEGTFHFIRCDLEDYRIAYTIMVKGVLSSTLRELPAGVQILYDQIRSLARVEATKQQIEATEVSLTQRQIREYTGQSQMSVKLAVRQLVEYEYLTLVRGGSERSKGFYRLKEDAEIGRADLSMIPTPEHMKRLWAVRSQ